MNSTEESEHYRQLFEILDDARKLKLVADLRDVAIERLARVVGKVPRGMSERIKAAYRAKGISIEWDLTTTDAFEFCLAAQKAGLSGSQRSAGALLYFCTEALAQDAVPPPLQQSIVKAYAGLDADYVAMGRQSPASRMGKLRHADERAIIDAALQYWRENIDPKLSAKKATDILADLKEVDGLEPLFPFEWRTLYDHVRRAKKGQH